MREFTSKPFKFDLKASNGLHMAGNSAISSTNLENYESIAQANAATLSKKTRDFIGENLIDIENTLKALNLDFLQTFSELEKNDSAETLFGEHYAYEPNINPKILSTALKLTKFPQSYGSVDASPKSAKSSSQFSPLDKQMLQNPFIGMQYLNDSSSNDKLLDGKRSSTPDTGFASRETTTSSRRGSQKSSYSPQDSHFSPIYGTQAEDARNVTGTVAPAAVYAKMSSVPFPNRQRSMSFTENYEMSSPVLSEPQAKVNFPSVMTSSAHSKLGGDGAPMLRSGSRRAFGYKPKSIRARNLRRMSYNPIFLESSSSSSSETEFEHRTIAQSEVDIRSKLFSGGRHRENGAPNQYLHRKTPQFQSNNSAFVPSPDKLYGSNASIKSAPHYNYASDRQLHRYFDQKYRMRSCEADESQPSNPFDRSSRGSSRRRQRGNYVLPPPPPPPSATYSAAAASAINFDMFAQFDVSKLTGKSPTTQTFMQEMFPESKAGAAAGSGTPTRQPLLKQSPLQSAKSPFQWPEKIHVSAVQMGKSLWPSKHPTPPPVARNGDSALEKPGPQQHFTSDSSSSTETDFQATEFNPRIPPSPAHE